MINLDELLQGVHSVAVCGHLKPDGDAFGSCMGMYLFLKKYYPAIDSRVYLAQPYSDTFLFIRRSEEIQNSCPEREPFDLVLALDCADKARLGEAQRYFEMARNTVVIDHHISNAGFGKVNEIQAFSSSTAELIALLIGKERIDRDIAEALYMGLAHDTGMFQYSNTSSRSMMVGGWLMDTGIDFSKIVDDTFFKKSYPQNQVLGYALTSSRLILDGKVIYSVITRKVMDSYGIGPADLDGIVQQLRVTEGVEVALFLYEVTPREFKASMRANREVDVSKIALSFGGGGHKRAAGCTLTGSLEEALERILFRIGEALG